jgi:outer membrane protein OmpA-like peptidoglycan-associated protein
MKSPLSDDDKRLLENAVHQVLDGQATKNGKKEFGDLLSRLEQKGITRDMLCKEFTRAGVNPSEVNKYQDKGDFLTEWFLPPYGPGHQAYSHKGYDYDYSKDPDTKDYWTPENVQQSWLVKKYTLEKIVKNIYNTSDEYSKNIAATLYSIHRLRDLQTNGSDENARLSEHLLNVTDDLKKYTLPLYKNDPRMTEKIKAKIEIIEKGISEFKNSGSYNGINNGVEGLIGDFSSSQDGILNDLSIFVNAPKTTNEMGQKPASVRQIGRENHQKQRNLGNSKGSVHTDGGAGLGFSFDPRLVGIIMGIIALVVLAVLLLKDCNAGKQQPEGGKPGIIDPPKPRLPDEPVKSIRLPDLTYNDIHFIKDTRFFLSEGNRYTNFPPDMTEGKHDERLYIIAQDMKNILAVAPDQIFIISGHAADIPGHDVGEMELSVQRAEKVKDIFINLGIPHKNLECVYIGGTNKWGNNLTEETKKLNRVVTIVLKNNLFDDE